MHIVVADNDDDDFEDIEDEQDEEQSQLNFPFFGSLFKCFLVF